MAKLRFCRSCSQYSEFELNLSSGNYICLKCKAEYTQDEFNELCGKEETEDKPEEKAEAKAEETGNRVFVRSQGHVLGNEETKY